MCYASFLDKVKFKHPQEFFRQLSILAKNVHWNIYRLQVFKGKEN